MFQSTVNLDFLEWCFDFFKRKQFEITIPWLNFTCKKSKSFATTLTPLLVVVMEFSQHVIHEQALTLLKAFICGIKCDSNF